MPFSFHTLVSPVKEHPQEPSVPGSMTLVWLARCERITFGWSESSAYVFLPSSQRSDHSSGSYPQHLWPPCTRFCSAQSLDRSSTLPRTPRERSGPVGKL